MCKLCGTASVNDIHKTAESCIYQKTDQSEAMQYTIEGAAGDKAKQVRQITWNTSKKYILNYVSSQ